MPLLQVKNLSKDFYYKNSKVTVLAGVNLSLAKNSICAIIGESASGKSTLAKIIAGLEKKTFGMILFEKQELIFNLETRKKIQLIFQNPASSFNPLMKVREILLEPLKIHFSYSREEKKRALEQILHNVALSLNILERYPHELSGGEAQRVAIARALLLKPALLILDEPLSQIDEANQKTILSFLKEIKEKFRLTYLFISHDLNIVKDFSDYTAVLSDGKIIEMEKTPLLFKDPKEHYTKELLGYLK